MIDNDEKMIQLILWLAGEEMELREKATQAHNDLQAANENNEYKESIKAGLEYARAAAEYAECSKVVQWLADYDRG